MTQLPRQQPPCVSPCRMIVDLRHGRKHVSSRPDSRLHSTPYPLRPPASGHPETTRQSTPSFPQQDQGHVGDASGPTLETAPAQPASPACQPSCPAALLAFLPCWRIPHPGRPTAHLHSSRPARNFSRQYGPGLYLYHVSTRRFPGPLRETAGHIRVTIAQQCLSGPGGGALFACEESPYLQVQAQI